jgi:hypothetical protein
MKMLLSFLFLRIWNLFLEKTSHTYPPASEEGREILKKLLAEQFNVGKSYLKNYQALAHIFTF